ncbi:hypothetical protein, partial [Mesorhizobium sp. M1C.F.Ca.ET.144.01.1.1]|uniref:hypothetical protein n=1 Tax=Mesorhizobium sp. M1C.F.Ca.ET.144.01.1.1 TaxID=2563921 RepID=UPI001679D850
DALPPPALEAIFLGTIARSITAKLFNELAGGAVKLSSDTATLRSVENTLRDYIQGKVSDVFAAAGRMFASISRSQIDCFVKTIYEGAFALFEAFGE